MSTPQDERAKIIAAKVEFFKAAQLDESTLRDALLSFSFFELSTSLALTTLHARIERLEMQLADVQRKLDSSRN